MNVSPIHVMILGPAATLPSDDEAGLLKPHGIEARRLAVPTAVLGSRLRRLFEGRKLADPGRDASPTDLIHASCVEAADLALEVSARWGCPYVLSINEFLSAGEGFRLARRAARGILVPEAALGGDLARTLAVPERFVSRIPFGIDVVCRDEHRATGYRPAIGTASGTGLGMGLPVFYEAAARVLAAGVEAEFVVAAEPGRGVFARGLADAMGLRGRVAIVDDADLDRAFWPALDLYCHPARRATTGRPLLDALARGVPSVASDVASLADIADGGSAAQLVRPGDAEALAQALLRLLVDPVAARRLGRSGQARIAERHAPAQRAEALAQFYRVAVASAPRRRDAPSSASPNLRSYTLAQQRKS